MTQSAVARVLALVTATLGLGLSPAQHIGHVDTHVRAQMDVAQVRAWRWASFKAICPADQDCDLS